MELSDLPSIDALVNTVSPQVNVPRPLIVAACRNAIDDARGAILDGQTEVDPEATVRTTLADIEASRPAVVVNATGVLLHTNLGRAIASDSAVDAASHAMKSATNVEVDLRTGKRSKRLDYLASLVPAVTDAEAGIAVNNTAGALLLTLAALAGKGGRVAVSRGELIEIGGSFRLPELMAASGAELVEVGTTNRTRISDFAAVVATVDVLLKVHPSNYRIEGFQEEATHLDLVELARQHDVPVVYDVGSGLIDASAPWLGDSQRGWLAGEPGVRQAIADGCDVVMFSGDKLLGGPQAGVIAGRADLIGTIAKHPIARAVRLDGPTIAALASTLEAYANQQVLELPFWAMAAASVDDIEQRAKSVIDGIGGAALVAGESLPGAGTVPGLTIPTKLIRIDGPADEIWSELSSHGVVGSRRDGSVFLDLRSVKPGDDATVRAALLALHT